MNSLFLRTSTQFLLPILFLFSIFLLLRGHNLPGGGFIGGLVAASAILLQLVSGGTEPARQLFSWDFKYFIGFGLLLAVLSGLPGLFSNSPFLTGIWISIPWDTEYIKLGTPLLFDLGVYLVVIGVSVEIILGMAEEETWKVF